MTKSDDSFWTYMFAAWGVAVVASLGALFIGEVLGQAPCVLCWYQRIAMFPLVIILGLGAYLDDRNAVLHALPLSVIGGAIAAFHVLVYFGFVPEAIQPCTANGPSCSGAAMTAFSLVPLPVLSLAAFALITLFLIPVARKRRA